jgi:hypothetical protein
MLAACGTVEDNARLTGIPPTDAYEISRIIHASHPTCKIYSYHPSVLGGILVMADCGSWHAQRVNGHWQVTEAAIITQSMHTLWPNQALQPTATRYTFTFFMTKTVPEIFSRALGSRG